jgi:hypothetical protein
MNMTKISLFCKYCGSKNVKWIKEKKKNGQMGWLMVDVPSGEPHWKTCTTPRDLRH